MWCSLLPQMPSKDECSMHFTSESTGSAVTGPSNPFTFPPVRNKQRSQGALAEKAFTVSSPFLKGKNTPSCYMLCDSGDLKLLCLSLSFKPCHQLLLKECCKTICLRKVLQIKQSLGGTKPSPCSADPQSGPTRRQ